MTFDTTTYTREHGRSPRGRGSWAFYPWLKHNSSDYLSHTVLSPGGMTLTEAKYWARQQQQLAGVAIVAVMP